MVGCFGGGSTLAPALVPSLSHLHSLLWWWVHTNSSPISALPELIVLVVRVHSSSSSISASAELIVVGRSTPEKCGVNSTFLSTDSFLLHMIG